MKRPYLLFLMLWCLLLVHQTVYADGITRVVFNEDFNKNNGTGGNHKEGVANDFSGNIASSKIVFSADWDSESDYIYGGYQCMRFGNKDNPGSCTTSALDLIDASKTATLTFRAAGWGGTGENKLTITAEGADLSGQTEIALTNAEWTNYEVTISNAKGEFTITFAGKRGFLDDVKIEETVNTLSSPTITESTMFWPYTIEEASKSITIRPANGTTVHYTTDGTDPSASNGTLITMATNLHFTETKTVKAIAFYDNLTSDIISNIFTLGGTVNSISEFTALADGTEARIFLSAEQNARITDVSDKQFTVKDGAGTTLLFDFGNVAFNPTPAANQHIAGWIIGKKQTTGDKATFVATTHTTPAYMAFAAPVTEPDVTSIKAIANQQEAKDNTYYNLSGQRVKAPKKGLYIANGKKLIIH